MSINKAIITGIGILGSVASLYALSQGNGLQQKTQGENSPNINAAKGDVQVSIDNSTKVEASLEKEIPNFSGEIGNLDEATPFVDFLVNHEGDIVYLDIYFDSFPSGYEKPQAISHGEDWFLVWFDCRELPVNETPNARHCKGMNYNVTKQNDSDAIWGYNQGFQYLKGYWAVRSDFGMHQGMLSTTLTAVNTQDAK